MLVFLTDNYVNTWLLLLILTLIAIWLSDLLDLNLVTVLVVLKDSI